MKAQNKYRHSAGFVAAYFLVIALAIGDKESFANDKGLVLVAGATGGTGRATVSELTRNGYRVRAFVRNIESAREKLGDDVQFAEGDVRDRDAIDAAMDGVSIVISAIGAGRGDPSNGPEFVDYGGVKNLVESAAATGAQQFVLVSSMGVTHEDHALNKMFNNILIWKFKGEEVLRNSGIAYTVVRPGGLIDEAGGESSLLFQQGDTGEGRIPRADVARVIVTALSQPEARDKTFEVISGDGPPAADLREQFAALEDD
jgi:uncharacterized protein YbjT (DUF2867 family)